jgi:hypothetical protein
LPAHQDICRTFHGNFTEDVLEFIKNTEIGNRTKGRTRERGPGTRLILRIVTKKAKMLETKRLKKWNRARNLKKLEMKRCTLKGVNVHNSAKRLSNLGANKCYVADMENSHT